MSERTNEDKLRILQERLTNSRKKRAHQETKVENKKHVPPTIEEDLVNGHEIDSILPNPRKPKIRVTGLKYFILFFSLSLFGYGMYVFMYGTVTLESLFSYKEKKEYEEVLNNKDLVYYQSEFNGKYIVLLNSYESM